MKLIGITQRIDVIENYGEIREALDIKWIELLLKCGYMPVVLSATVNPQMYFENFAFAGILLTGGNDLASVNNTAENRMRDVFEKKLIDISISTDIPILGVCRGMQVIGEFFGLSIRKCDRHVASKHRLNVDKMSNLFKMIKNEELTVNSYHNYCLENISKNGLRVAAVSEDGTVEAVEHQKYKISAHMWHPERVNPFSEDDMNILHTAF